MKVRYINVIKWWLTGFLIIVPFHFTIFKIIKSWNYQLASIFNRLDELTIIILLPLALIKLYKVRNIPFQLVSAILLPIIAIIVFGLVSGLVNGNSLIITALGTFDYVKHFFIIFIYAAYFRDFDRFKKVFQILLILTVLIGLVAVIQEGWAVYSKYIINKDVYNMRMGMFRVSSLLSHYNLLGLFCLLVLTIYLFMMKKIHVAIMLPIVSGVIFSVSRTAYLGFTVLAGVQIFRGRRWLTVFLIPILIGLVFMSTLDDLDVRELVQDIYNRAHTVGAKGDIISFRDYARQKAMLVWEDHPVFGVGPGMFGGPTALKYRSPIYEEYNFHIIHSHIKSLDQFWPQALAEIGIVGTAAFAGLLISLFTVTIVSIQHVASDDIKGLFAGLAIFVLIIFIYTFSGNLNIISILFPFNAFIGIALANVKLETNN